MGEKTITTQVKIDGNIVPDFSFDWAVEFQGEKYIMPLRIPAGSKDNEKLKSQIDLTFQHWAIYQLKRWPFVTIQQIAAGTYMPDEEVATVQLNLKDFCILFGQVLEYYYGNTITIDLNPAWQYDSTATLITISHTKIWNVLIDAFHDKYGVRWEIKAASDNSNTVKGGERYVIRVGYPTTEVDHIFEYGFEGGLLKVERQTQSEEICNILKGRGGETNIPFRYFKNTDPNNPDFSADPDWVIELKDIYFPNLMGATFRSYVQGWKAKHINQKDSEGKLLYPRYKAVGEANAYAPWAYRKGYNDIKFSPVEFVADEIITNLSSGATQVEVLPGFSPIIKRGSSIDKYGPLFGTLDNNDEIYPTLQGTGLDIAVAVEEIESDDVEESVDNEAKIRDISGCNLTVSDLKPSEYKTVTLPKTSFEVSSGMTANLITEGITVLNAWQMIHSPYWGNRNNAVDVATSVEIVASDTVVKVYNAITHEERSASGIPEGRWYYEVTVRVHNFTTDKTLKVSVGWPSPQLKEIALSDNNWKNTFDIWVKNIWNSTKLSTETASQYAERVWKPVLGDREKNTAKVVFTSGALAVSEDYEFTIVDFPVPDTSMTWEEKNDSGVVIATHTSHWRIKLAKSEAELEATGLYVPSTKKQGKAGDTFVFIGTEMTHVPYVVDAEKRLDDWKKDQLGEVKEIKPTFVVTTDRVRLNGEGAPDALINQLRVGNSIRLADKRFIQTIGDIAYETLYLQSITYTFREPTKDDAALNPDVEIVLGEEYTTSANPVSMMQGEISALQRQVGAISNVEQIVRAVGDKLYLRKDGISDRSLSPTQFFSLLTSGDFRAGLIGGVGWGFFKDENGEWVLEVPRLNVRHEMSVNTLVINQANGRGGMEIDTAAYMEIVNVIDMPQGYVCYFDQKNGSIANLFHVDDVAFCNQWTAENNDLKNYKRRVTAVNTDSITLSKTDVNGQGIPQVGDIVIHFGNYTDATRQYVKVRDVVGGGYERYIEALNSVDAEGVEYYFVGKQAGQSRWFVGNKDLVPYSGAGDGSYIEYINRKFNLHNVSLSVGSTIGDKTLNDYFTDLIPEIPDEYDDTAVWAEINKYKYLRNALLPENPTQITGGLIMSTLISLGYTDASNIRHTLAGMNGSWVDTLGGRTIGSWWGGPMVDKFNTDDTVNDSLSAGSYATSLIRMDGTGYFVDGLFRIKKTGLEIGDTANGYGISMGMDGRLTLGNGIVINIGGEAKGLTESIASVTNLANAISNLFTPYNGTTARTWQDVLNGADFDAVKVERAFFTDFSLAGKGLAPAAGSTGGGGGSLFGLYTDTTWVSVPAESDALSAVLGKSLHARVSVLEGAGYLTGITKAMVEAVLTGDVTSHAHSLLSKPADNRSVATMPEDYNGKFFFTGMKRRDALSAPGSDTYVNGFGWRGWSDSSGGKAWEVFGDNADLYVRCGATTTWEAWRKILTDGNYASTLDDRYVTRTTAQEITAEKTFAAQLKSTSALLFKLPSATNGIYFEPIADGGLRIQAHTDYTWQKRLGTIDWNGGLTMNSFIRNGGTAAQFLMADGSLTTKVVASAIANTGWQNNAVDDLKVPTMSFLAYWNGAHTNGGSSNLQYCDRGRFGTMAVANAADYTRKASLTISAGGVAKITLPNSGCLISIRGLNGGRAALVWVTGYYDGTSVRNTARIVYSSSNYSFYFNGTSESSGCVYVKSAYTSGDDTITVTGLYGTFPTLTSVGAVPSDATVIGSSDALATTTSLDTRYVNSDGDTMAGNLHMGTNKITFGNLYMSDAGGRLAVWTSAGNAGPFNVGSLLVSNAWADATKVPTNGIYSKGVISSGVAAGTAPFTVLSSTMVSNLNANYLGGYTHEQIRRNALGFTPTVVPTSSGNCDLDLLKDGMARNYWAPEKWVHAPEDFGYGAAVVFAPFGYTNLHGQLAWDVNHAQDNVTRNLYWRVFATATGGTDKWGGWRQFAFTDLGYGMQETTIDATGLNANTYYPVTFALDRRSTVRIEFLTALDSYTKPAWSTHSSGFSVRLIVEVNGDGWGISNLNTTVYEADYRWASAPPVAGLGQMTNSSTEYVYVRGGGRYRIRTSHGVVPVLRTSSYTISSQTIAPTTTVPAEIKRTNALITDNVASASKLYNDSAFTAWGQIFFQNGVPKSISGELKHVTAIRFDSGNALVEGAHNSWNLWSNYGFMFYPSLSSTVSALTVQNNGRVGVNMYAPAYDFDVTGVIHASGEIFSDKAIGGKGTTSSSDIRQKHIIGDFVMSLDDVLKMPLKRFKWRDGPDKDERIGVIAQEALKIVPQVVYLKPDGFYGVDYGALAHAEVKTVANVVTQLVERINKLESQLNNRA